MKVSEYARKQILSSLIQKRVVVWYDSEVAFEGFVANFQESGTQVVRLSGSRLQMRKEAEQLFRQICRPDASLEMKNGNLLIYLPYTRVSGEARLQDPFEVFAVAGDTFGDAEAEQLRSLALQALPGFSDQIERLFREGKPTLDLLDHLENSPTYPLVGTVLGTQSAIEVAVRLLGNPDTLSLILGTPGALLDVVRLLNDELGFSPKRGESDPDQIKKQLGRYILFSEFALEILADLPAELANLAPLPSTPKERIQSVTDRLRQTDAYRDSYLAFASLVEVEYKLEQLFLDKPVGQHWGVFPFQEKRRLQEVSTLLQKGDITAAREILADFHHSVWRYLPDREQFWWVAERCAELLSIAVRIDKSWKQNARTVAEMVSAYTADQGWYELDRAQRLFEQSLAKFAGQDELSDLIAVGRSRYRQIIDAIQERFLERIQEEGWPPEGFLRHTQVYERFVAPALANREKVIYVLSDALRYEMGRDLLRVFNELGQADIQTVTAALPTITTVGMAALLPNADGALQIKAQDGNLIPYFGELALKDINARMAYFREKLGDRLVEIEISTFLSLSSKKQQEDKVGKANLVVLRDTRIDALGENVSLLEARRYMTEMLGDIKSAITQLIKLGYSRIVVAADHGHVLLPEIKPGDVVTTPGGEWGLSKRRMRLGNLSKESAGIICLNAKRLGIQGDAEDLILPVGYGVYAEGSGYFHGGISLQETVLPIITLRAVVQSTNSSAEQVKIIYNKKSFTSAVIGVKLFFTSLFTPQLRVKIEVFDGPGAKAKKVGDVAECEARDDVTHEIMLKAGVETPAPLLLEHDFSGEGIDVRVIDPDTQRIWDHLSLKSGMMD